MSTHRTTRRAFRVLRTLSPSAAPDAQAGRVARPYSTRTGPPSAGTRVNNIRGEHTWRAYSYFIRLEDSPGAVRGNDALQVEPARAQQVGEFGECALAAGQQRQHVYIAQKRATHRVTRLRSLGQHALDYQESRAWADGAAAVAQDLHHLVVRPVVQDPRQDV